MQDVTTIWCSRCDPELPPEAFHPSQRKRGAWCKPCRNAYANARNRAHHRGKPRDCKACGVTFTRWEDWKHPGSAATRCRPCYLAYVRDRMTPKARQTGPRQITRRSVSFRLLRAQVIDEETNCGFCGEVVDKTLRYPDRGSASIDHIIPVSQGGTHDRSNLRLAHLGCNARGGQALAGSLSMERVVLLRAALWLGEHIR